MNKVTNVAHHPLQLLTWLTKCRDNIESFRQNRHDLPTEGQIETLRHQYVLLEVALKVIKGHARFEGV